MRVLNSTQMREADRRTIDDVGMPSVVLMENAGRQVADAMATIFDDLASARVAVLCGRGNNGGDGFVAARVLMERQVDVSVYLIGQTGDVRGDARVNLAVLRNLGLDVVEIADASTWELRGTEVLSADVIVDAMFGTGLAGPLEGLAKTIVDDVNASPRPVVAVDLPSGLSADRHDVPGPAIDAAVTVTMAAPKLPLILPPAEALVGKLVVAEIGIPEGVIEDLEGPRIELLTAAAMRALVSPRVADSHKGDYGRVVIAAGSRGRTGAAALAARAALRSGAGLVTVATPASCQAMVAAHGSEYMTLALDETPDGLVAAAAADRVLASEADVIVAGPGLGRSPEASAFVKRLVDRAGVTLVLDADAVVAFADEPERLAGRDGTDIVITPHPGEMAVLGSWSVDEVQAHRIDVARDFATTHRLTVVLKGHRTVVATPDGRVSINPTGNPGMATAGTGDVLAGILGAWAAQLLDPEQAARLAVYLHGMAGDMAEADEGEVALVAGDLIDRLGDAVLDLTARRRRRPPDET